MVTGMMANTFFGLTTTSGLAKAQADRDHWRRLFFETNEDIERFQIENKALKKELDALKTKYQALGKDLADCKIWAAHLEVTNKDQAALLAKQVATINAALDESAKTSLIHNQATIDISSLKLANKQYREAVKIAADNFILLITN